MRIVRLMIGSVACLACGGGLTGTESGKTYTTNFSVQFVENSVHQGTVRLTCADTYTLTGIITAVIRGSSATSVDGEGRVNATQTWSSVSGAGCTRGPDRSTSGEWTTDLVGTPNQVSFSVQRASAGPFVITTTFGFAGALSGGGVVGNLTFTQAGRGITGGTVTSTSDASALVSVALR